ncbi:MAG: hypothetical protein ABH878_00125 [bacterium]
MTKRTILLSAGALLFSASLVFAGTSCPGRPHHPRHRHYVNYQSQARGQHPHKYIDENGDGICDLHQFGRKVLRDADGDGIPNGKDQDFLSRFKDENGDGICDYRQNAAPVPDKTD